MINKAHQERRQIDLFPIVDPLRGGEPFKLKQIK